MAPVYPDAARRLQLTGTVGSPRSWPQTGRSRASRLIGGHPLLIVAATESGDAVGIPGGKRDREKSIVVRVRPCKVKADTMTISRKLHFGFGSIIAIIVILFVGNRACSVRHAATRNQRRARERAEFRGGSVEDRGRFAWRWTDYLLTGDRRQQTTFSVENGHLAELIAATRLRTPNDCLREVLNRLEADRPAGPTSSHGR